MNHEPLPAQGPVDVNVSHEAEELFADYPKYTPGRIGWWTLLQIVEWQDRHGICDVSAETTLANKAGGGMAEVCYLAAVVEMTEPSNAEVSGGL